MDENEKQIDFSTDESDIDANDTEDLRELCFTPSRKFLIQNRSNNEAGIHSLPPEIIFKILTYLKIKHIIRDIALVSRYFYDFIMSEEFTQHRLAGCFVYDDSKFMVSEGEMIHYESCGIYKVIDELETAKSLAYDGVHEKSLSACHFGDVHCVKILDAPCTNIALSGSRDKAVCVYKLDKIEGPELINTSNEHSGWVWTLDQEDGRSSRVVSGSWDSYVFLYDIGRSTREKTGQFQIHSAALCTRFEVNFLLVGTYSKFIVGVDMRSGKETYRLKHHTKPVLGLTSSPDYIFSSGEDHALSCYDKRAGRLFKRIRLERISSSIQYCEPYLWLGGFDGTVKVFNKDMKIISKFSSDHEKPITGLSHSLGTTATSSKDGTVKVFTPNIRGKIWKTFHVHKEVTAIDYKDGFLMAGGCDNTVNFWWNQ